MVNNNNNNDNANDKKLKENEYRIDSQVSIVVSYQFKGERYPSLQRGLLTVTAYKWNQMGPVGSIWFQFVHIGSICTHLRVKLTLILLYKLGSQR